MSKYNEIVEQTYIETLENLAFVFSDRIGEKEALELIGGNEFYLSQMEFSGGLDGSLKLAAEKEIGNIIADNMLGGIEEENGSLFMDSLKEITNVICGKLVTEIAGTEPIIDLTIPEVSPIDQEACKQLLQDDQSLIFNSEEYLVVIVFNVND